MFVQAEDGYWDGRVKAMPDNLDTTQAARLMTEAGDIYKETLDNRH